MIFSVSITKMTYLATNMTCRSRYVLIRRDKRWIMIMMIIYNDDMQGHNSMRDLTLDKQPASMSLEVAKRNISIPNSDSERVGGKVFKLFL